MPKPVKKDKRPSDINQLAHRLVELSTEGLTEAPGFAFNLSGYMSAIGRKGGQIGGKRRLKTMTAEQRRRVAQKAAKARWKKARKSLP